MTNQSRPNASIVRGNDSWKDNHIDWDNLQQKKINYILIYKWFIINVLRLKK